MNKIPKYLGKISAQIKLNPEQAFICKKLNQIHFSVGIEKIDADQLYMGALFTISDEMVNKNPDWISQSSNSIRELLYHLSKFLNKKSTLKNHGWGSQERIEKYHSFVFNHYIFFTKLAHHDQKGAVGILYSNGFVKNKKIRITKKLFIDFFQNFERNLYEFLKDPVKINKDIDQFLKSKQPNKSKLNALIASNKNARSYFFTNATPHFIDFLDQKNYFKILSKPFSPADNYPAVPEAYYLAYVAAKKPKKVLAIIRKTKIPRKTNPRILANFLKAFSEMPERYFFACVEIILRGKWVERHYSDWLTGYEYFEFFKKIIAAKKFDLAIKLARVLLQPKPDKWQKNSIDVVVYLDDWKYEEILKLIVEVPGEWRVEVAKIMRDQLIKFFAVKHATNKFYGKRPPKQEFDDYGVVWCESLYDFAGKTRITSIKETLFAYFQDLTENYLASIKIPLQKKKFVDDLLGRQQQEIFRRLRIYLFDLHPEVFIAEIKQEIFNPASFDLFERQKLVQHNFGLVVDQKKYVDFVFEQVQKTVKDRKKDAQKFKKYLTQIRLGSIAEQLDQKILEYAEKRLGEEIGKSEPKPLFSSTSFHAVGRTSPYAKEKIAELKIADLIAEMIKFRGSEREFDVPSISGFRDTFAEAIAEDPRKYSAAAKSFQNPDLLSDYLYGYFRGFEKVVGTDTEGQIEWQEVFDLIANILQRYQEKTLKNYEKIPRGGIEVYWHEVLSAILDLIEKAIKAKSSHFSVTEYEREILTIATKLKDHADPSDSRKLAERDPASIAVNSIRGKVIKVILHFIMRYNREKGGERKDAKKFFHPIAKAMLVERFKKESHPAVRFLFGQHLGWLHYIDPHWKTAQLPDIFTGNVEQRLVALEGYLSSNLYESLFNEMRGQYAWLIKKTAEGLPERKYSLEINQSLAQHLAIAFAYDFIDFDDDLIQQFFDQAPATSRGKMIGILGRGYISLNKTRGDDLSVDKFKKLWENRLANSKDLEELKEFAWWCDTERFDEKFMLEKMRDTLKKTDGVLSADHVLVDQLTGFAERQPLLTAEILEFLLKHKAQAGAYFSGEEKIKTALSSIYHQKDDKQAKARAEKIVNDLVGRGLWNFREIID